MAESITLTTPVTKAPRATVRITGLHIALLPSPTVTVEWIGDNGDVGTASYPTPANNGTPSGATLINQLNTANLTTTSLVKRILQRLQTDGYIGAGSISGTPD